MSAAPKIHCPIQHENDVVPCEPAELDPLLGWLGSAQPVSAAQRFTRGTALPDGRLDLCKQDLGARGGVRVFSALQLGSGVRHLLLGTNGLGDSGVKALGEHVAQGGELETAFLGCNQIGPQGARDLVHGLADDEALRGLWIKRNPLGDPGVEAIAELLNTHRHLRTLDLVNTGFGPRGLEALVEALLTGVAPVERVYLGGNRLGPEHAPHLARLLRETSRLGELYLGCGRLGDPGVATLAEGLAANTTLTTLALASNGVGPAGLRALLPACGRLRILDLGQARSAAVLGEPDNALGSEGAQLLADWLATNPSLRWLTLSQAGLDGRGAKALEAAVAENTTLLRLTLGKGLPRRVKRRINARLRENLAATPVEDQLTVPADVLAIQSVYRTY